MQKVDQGVVFQSVPGRRQSLTFPGITMLPSGRWLCTMRGAPTKGGTVEQQALLTWSDDEGKTWSPPLEPFTPAEVDGRPGQLRGVYATALGNKRVLATMLWVDHSDPSLPFFNETTEGLLDCKLFFSISEDDGVTWGEPWLMDSAPFTMPIAITGPTLLLPNGEWACQFELNKPYYDTTPWRHSSVLMMSSDEGKTWPRHVVASNDPDNLVFYWDQRPGLLADSSILDLFWTYDNSAAAYLNIHARASTDNLKAFGEMWDTGVPGQPAPPVSLGDGRILLVYVDRTAATVIKARISDDGGRTFPAATEFVVQESMTPPQTENKGSMQDAWAEMGKFSMGLPATTLLENGDVLVVFYSGVQTDNTNILWARLRA